MKKKYFEGKNYKDTLKYLKEIRDKEKKKYKIKVLGKELIVYPSVFSPKYFKDPEFFAKKLPIKKGDYVLEIGPGTGILSIFSIFKGASKVVAIDINPKAVKNTKENAKLHGVSNKIRVLKGNVFGPLKKEKFDIIIWNTPWGRVKKKNLTNQEKGLWDSDYRATERFIKNAKNFLKPNGKILIGFSISIGDFEDLKRMLKKYGYIYNVISKVKSKAINFESTFEIIEVKPI